MMNHDDGCDDTNTLSLDACLELLANRERRVILGYFLAEGVDHASVDEVTSEIIDDQTTATGERPGHTSIQTSLFHVHLPKFADADVLDYDTRHLEIRYRGDSKLEAVYSKIQELQ